MSGTRRKKEQPSPMQWEYTTTAKWLYGCIGDGEGGEQTIDVAFPDGDGWEPVSHSMGGSSNGWGYSWFWKRQVPGT